MSRPELQHTHELAARVRSIRTEAESLEAAANTIRERHGSWIQPDQWRLDLPPGLVPADFIPGYAFVREIHRGGQGIVYEALQISTQRRVAIKLIYSASSASSADAQRFDREAELLFTLRHPNIVRVHDAGSSSGVRFLVMDYVAGIPIDRFFELDGNSAMGPAQAAGHGKTGLNTRLELFARVCDAVNAAHIKGILHRDLKPANILVSGAVTGPRNVVAAVNERPEPIILDFGLAKLLSADAPESDPAQAMTQAGQFLGSLPWSSPEQAARRNDEIDIRSDVYSLGVVLYQVLTGTFPYDLRGSFREIADRIIHTAPIPLRAIVAGARHSENAPSKNAPHSSNALPLDDEIETIVMKCLGKDRGRRYGSAGHLADDLRRYLEGAPIEAKRDSSLYVMSKLVRRHRVPVALSLALLVAMVVGSIGLFVFWRNAIAERARAETQSRTTLDFANVMSDLVAGLDARLLSDNPEGRRAMREFDGLVQEIPERLAGQSAAEVELRRYAARVYEHIGRLDDAYSQLTAGMTRVRTAFGEVDERYATLLVELIALDQARADTTGSVLHARELVALRRRQFGDQTAASSRAHAILASALYGAGDLAAADVEISTAVSGLEMESADAPTHLKAIADELNHVGGYSVALPLLERAVQLAREVVNRRSEFNLQLSHILHSYGVVLRETGRLEAARKIQEECLELRLRIYADSPDQYYIFVTEASLGYTLMLQREFGEAERLLLDAEKNYDPPVAGAELANPRREMTEWLTSLYEEWNRNAPSPERARSAQEWRMKLKATAPQPP